MQRTENPWILARYQSAPQRFLAKSFHLNRAIALSGRQIEIDLLRKQAEIWQNASVAQRLVCLASTQKMRFRLPLPAQMSHPAVGVQGQLIYPDCSKESL